MQGRSWPWYVPLVILGVVLAATLPYFLAARAAGDDYIFGGFLMNPLDGNSYLAKMYEGWRGDWLFTLPYSPEVDRGSYIYLFYLLLGHLARWLNIDLVILYHSARVLGALILLSVLYDFIKTVLPDEPARGAAFTLAAVGSGMGWLTLGSGALTPDFWVAEGFPFLSIYSNPHFTFSLALILWLLKTTQPAGHRIFSWRQAGYFCAALVLGLMAPFGVILVLVILGGVIAWDWKDLHQKSADSWLLRNFLWILIGGSIPIIYELWAIRSDPILAAWNAQNLTPSPPVWQTLVAVSPALVLAGIGAWYTYRGGATALRSLVIWLLAGLVLMYLPWALQRRFMLGLFIPSAILGVYGLSQAARRYPRALAYGLICLIAFSLPTNLVVLLSAQQGIATHNPQIYLRRDEAEALDWLRNATPEHALVLAAPDTGLFIPAYTGRRVIYGHPYETIHAEMAKNSVTMFYESGGEAVGSLGQYAIDYVFWGPREQALGSRLDRSNLRPVYQSGAVTIYAWDGAK